MLADTEVIEATALVLAPDQDNETAVVEWRVSPERQRQTAIWMDCIARWLNSLEARSKRGETRRAYQRDVNDFFLTFAAYDLQPWDVCKRDVWSWIEDMRTRGLSEATINRRLAAMSSLYTYAAEEYRWIEDGTEHPLWTQPNPFAGKSMRARLEPYERSVFLSTNEVIQLLRAIDTSTITGWRNLALIYGMFATTRRVNEWVNLRWGDIHDDPDGPWFSYRYKGGKDRKQLIPPDLWGILTQYISRSGRTLGPDDYVFIATTDAARHFEHTADDYDPTGRPITPSYVNRLLKRYGLPLGIAPDRLHAHALRHAGARFRKEHGADIYHVRDILGHKSIAITQIYFDKVLETPVDEFSGIVGEVLPKQLRIRFPQPEPTAAPSRRLRKPSYRNIRQTAAGRLGAA